MTARLSRRQFLVLSAATVAGLGVGFALWRRGRRHARRPDPWLTLGSDGRARLEVPFTELGQGTLLGITQLVAEELDLPPAAFTTVTAPMEARFLIKEESYTGGSGSIRPLFDDWRRLGAAARALVVAAAARRWSVAPAACRTEAGAVLHPDGRQRLGYGALATAAAAEAMPRALTLKPRAQWRVIGQPLPRPELRALVDGSIRYGLDTRVPGQLSAALAQCPLFGGRLGALDEAPARRLPGVHAVVRLEAAIAVVADSYWQAARGLAALAPEWLGGTPSLDSTRLARELDALAARADLEARPAAHGLPLPGQAARTARALAAAPARYEQRYRGPLLAHATLEPQNALAIVTADAAEIHAPTQHQSAVQSEVAAALGLPVERVRVVTTRSGGGYGRRLKADYAVLAARVARAVGRPVQLVWDRSEDLQHDYYRPAATALLSAALDAEGYPTLLRARTATTNDVITGSLDAPWYGLGDVRIEVGRHASDVPVGSWRSVDASLSGFFIESFVDELAARAGVDPLAYRLRLAAGVPRTQRVLEAVAERAGWGRGDGRALGLAAFAGWETHVAIVAEVERDAAGRPRARRLTCAFDCGTAVNPALVRAQVEGGMTMAASAALKERITLAGGRVRERNFDGYGLLTMAEAPELDVLLLETPGARIGGVGEPPVPAVAPALANALYRLTGERHRDLPLAAA